MKVTALIENKSIDDAFHAQHGLSLYIETSSHKMLFDTGQDDAFIKNAEMLGIDLSLVDIAVISHGHYDHGGGLNDFLNLNQKASVYLSKHAFEKHLKMKDEKTLFIGINQPESMRRIQLIDQDMRLNDSIQLFTDIDYQPSVIRDEHLYYEEKGMIKKEIFNHELYLVVQEHHHQVLFTGCSHKGIEHIIDEIERKLHQAVHSVIGGFHFSHYHQANDIETAYLQHLGKKMQAAKTNTYYACHCTGEEAFNVLEQSMGKKLASLSAGEQIII